MYILLIIMNVHNVSIAKSDAKIIKKVGIVRISVDK